MRSVSFDVVIFGGYLLHLPGYVKAIAEAARLGRRYALFQRTPALYSQQTRYFTMRASGLRTLEIHFKDSELIECFATGCLLVVAERNREVIWRDGHAFASKSYLCEKGSHDASAPLLHAVRL